MKFAMHGSTMQGAVALLLLTMNVGLVRPAGNMPVRNVHCDCRPLQALRGGGLAEEQEQAEREGRVQESLDKLRGFTSQLQGVLDENADEVYICMGLLIICMYACMHACLFVHTYICVHVTSVL
jgi:hypothetical protein